MNKASRRYTVYCREYGSAVLETDNVDEAATYVMKHQKHSRSYVVYDCALKSFTTEKIKKAAHIKYFSINEKGANL